MAGKKEFPSIKKLFTQSWQKLKKSLLKLFILNLVAGLSIAVVSLLIVLIFGLGLGVFNQFNINKIISQPANLILALLGLFILIAVNIVILVVAQASSMLIVVKPKNNPVKKLIKQAFGLVWPVFATGLISLIFFFPSFFLMIIPAVVIGVLFMFSHQEVVISGKKGLSALKGSMNIIKQNFWEVIGRILLLAGLNILVSALFNFYPALFARNSETYPMLLMSIWPIRFLLNMFVRWFSFCYTIVLYQQAKKQTDFDKEQKMIGVWLVSVLGWLLVFALAFFGVRALYPGT